MPKPKKQTHFEHVPVELVKRIAQQEESSSLTRPVTCAICEEPVTLEHCKINEDGEAVHDFCYVTKLTVPVSKVGRARP